MWSKKLFGYGSGLLFSALLAGSAMAQGAPPNQPPPPVDGQPQIDRDGRPLPPRDARGRKPARRGSQARPAPPRPEDRDARPQPPLDRDGRPQPPPGEGQMPPDANRRPQPPRDGAAGRPLPPRRAKPAKKGGTRRPGRRNDRPMPPRVGLEERGFTRYDAPLLGVANYRRGSTRKIALNFTGELQGLKGRAYIKPRKDGATQIKVRFDDLKRAPGERRYALWAVSPTGEYLKIGQVINTGEREEAEIRGETALPDFGLFVTAEESDVISPTGRSFAAIYPNGSR